MLHRASDAGGEAPGIVLVTQPAHARVAADLAEAWGGSDFGPIEPRLQILEATARHDDGWIDWEMSPRVNAETGWPHSYLDLPLETHLEIFRRGIAVARVIGRYVGLLVSRHATGLVRRHRDPASTSAGEAGPIRGFLAEQDRVQDELVGSLAAHGATRDRVTADALWRVSGLLSAWDALSLIVCSGTDEPRVVAAVPGAAGGERELTLTPRAERGDPSAGRGTLLVETQTLEVEPWPFRGAEVEVQFEGRRLESVARDDGELREMLLRAEPTVHRVRLVAPGSR